MWPDVSPAQSDARSPTFVPAPIVIRSALASDTLGAIVAPCPIVKRLRS